ncbi:MAG: S8 family peptidase, partial [Aureliella sp.]
MHKRTQSAGLLAVFPRSSAAPKKRRRNTKRLYRFESLEARHLMAADLTAFDTLNLDSSSYDPSHFLVEFRDASSGSSHLGASAGGATITKQVSSDGWYQATVGAGSNLVASMQAFQALSNVIVATPDFKLSLQSVPNDPSFGSLWGMENNGSTGLADADIDASQAWDYGTSSSVVVAVIDTGIDYTHPDLQANIWTNTREVAGNGIDDDGNGYVDDIRGWNFVAGNNNPMDDNGHGTHVSGTIGAVGNNGIGVAGVAWNVKLMALKFLDSSGSGLLSNAVSAIDYARTNGAKIINASWGGGSFSSVLDSAIQRFYNAGGIFVAAAGNDASNNATVASYPANYNNVISVAASTSSDTLASFSNYGTNVEIAAPGQSILSTVPNNSYAVYSGTSMATPHVSGALALLWGQAPSLTSSQL